MHQLEPALQVVLEADVHLEDRLRLQEIHDEDAVDIRADQHVRLMPFELLADHRLHGDLRRADDAFEQPRRAGPATSFGPPATSQATVISHSAT